MKFALKPIFQGQKNKAAAKAAWEGDFERAFAHVDNGANINSVYYFGEPLEDGDVANIGYNAIKAGRLDVLEKALDKGLDVNLSGYGRSPLVVYAITQKNEAAAKLLIEKGADVNDHLFSGIFSPLATARIYGLPAVEEMIKARLSPQQLEAARANDIPALGGKRPAPGSNGAPEF